MKILCRTGVPGPVLEPREGLPCGVPGLAIVRARTGEPGYTITHVRSGCSAGWFPDADPEAILAAALELGQLTDWTLPGNEVVTGEGGYRARAIVQAHGGILTGNSCDAWDIP